ncbi:MAG: hypothetical protein ACREQ8_07380 [Woeseiaceae bacterium]
MPRVALAAADVLPGKVGALEIRLDEVEPAWPLIQIAETILPLFDLDAAVRLLVVVLAIGFLPALAFAWAFQLTPEGLKREEAAWGWGDT